MGRRATQDVVTEGDGRLGEPSVIWQAAVPGGDGLLGGAGGWRGDGRLCWMVDGRFGLAVRRRRRGNAAMTEGDGR
jgi:hypothetical protein